MAARDSDLMKASSEDAQCRMTVENRRGAFPRGSKG
jgi:hypothetical protein